MIYCNGVCSVCCFSIFYATLTLNKAAVQSGYSKLYIPRKLSFIPWEWLK